MSDQNYPAGARVRVQVDFLIDPAGRMPMRGETVESMAAHVVEALIEECRDDVDGLRIMASEVISGPGLALWGQQPCLVDCMINPDDDTDDVCYGGQGTVDMPGDEPEGPYVRLRDTFTGAQGGLVGESEEQMARFFDFTQRVAPTLLFVDEFDATDNAARAIPVATAYSDALCVDCANALTVQEDRPGARLCAVCLRDRLRLRFRILAAYEDEDDHEPLRFEKDPDTGSYIDLTGPYIDDDDVRYHKIVKIFVPREHRQKRIGAALLQIVCDDADSTGTALLLEVGSDKSDRALDNEALEAWYARYGFTRTDHYRAAHRWMRRMAAGRQD